MRSAVAFALVLVLCGGLSACGGSDRPGEPGNADAIYEQRQERFEELEKSGGNLERRERMQARRAERFKAGDKTTEAREPAEKERPDGGAPASPDSDGAGGEP